LELSLNSISSGSEVTAVYSEYTAEASPKKEFFDDVKNVKSNNLIQNVFIPKYTAREIKIIGVYGLMKTKALKEIGGMPSLGSSFGPYSDTLVPILLSQFGSINFLQTSLCFLRTHDESLSISSFDVDEYSSSASDFLTEFINICRTVENINTEKCVFNMVSWFRDNDLDIISRNHSISKFRAGYNFICHQLKNNYSKIRPRYWLGFTISIISLLAVFTVRSMYKKIRI
jgi:hypothetical protein